MATTLGWLGYQHTLTRMFWSLWQEGSIIIAGIGWLQVDVLMHGLMVQGRMVFGKIISMVGVMWGMGEGVVASSSMAGMATLRGAVHCMVSEGKGATIRDGVQGWAWDMVVAWQMWWCCGGFP